MLYQYFPNLPSVGSLPDGCVLTQAVQQAWNKSRSCVCSDSPGFIIVTLLCYLFIGDTFSLTSFYFGVYQTHRLTRDCEHGHMAPRANRKDGRNSRLLLFLLFPPHSFSSTARIFPPPSSVPPPFTRWLSDKTGIFFSSSNQMWLHSTHLEITFSFRWSRPADLLLLPAAVWILCWD